MVELSKRHKEFADEYIITGNKYQSAIKAGYSENYAKAQSHKLLENVGIAEYINKRLKPIEEKREISADDALDKLISIWQGELQTSFSKHVDNLNDGEVIKDMTYEYTPDLDSVIKALDLYLRYKSLLSQTQLDKMKVEMELMKAKLEQIKNVAEETTEDKISELLNTIKNEVSDHDIA